MHICVYACICIYTHMFQLYFPKGEYELPLLFTYYSKCISVYLSAVWDYPGLAGKECKTNKTAIMFS